MAAPPLTIDEVRFPTEIAQGATGGPMFSTIIAAGKSGTENRVAQWVLGRRRWDVSHAQRDTAQADELVAFFNARRGRLYGFRFRDPSDYVADDEPLYPTGAPTVQLERTYTSGPVTSRRPIYKPVEAVGITVTREGSPFALFTVDWNSGTLFLTPDSTKAISGITQANGAVVSCTGHGFLVGDRIWFEGVGGMTQVNNAVHVITGVNANDFTISTNTTTYGAYTSGGSAVKYVQPSEELLWTGEFDIPARFDTDEMAMAQVDVEWRDWEGIPILELLGEPTVQEPETPGGDPIELFLAYRFEDSPGVTDNEGTGGADFDLVESGVCEG